MKPLPTNSLERALHILQFIGDTPGGLTNLEVSQRFQLARSTCSYILSRLEHEGYLTRDKETKRYRIGLETLTLARGALREVGFRVASEPTLYRLAMDTGLAANLAVIEGTRVVIIDRIEGPTFVDAALQESSKPYGGRQPARSFGWDHLTRDQRHIGDKVPLCATALGRVLLAHLPDQQFRSLMEQLSDGQEHSQDATLVAELMDIRQQGYCMMQFEPHNESCALAAPILDRNEVVRAAVSVSCRRHLKIWNNQRSLSETVKDAAWEISCRLSYPKLLQTDSSALLHPHRRGAVTRSAAVRSS